ncbi:MAG: class I tRNA ligase family protein [Bacteroidota bacterium]
MDYNFRDTEKKWQDYWKKHNTYRVTADHKKPKFYVLDMFPYPSGAGLHVGHPLGYIASDIYSRYMRLRGYNVLHPMGYDAFGLPAEQYAIQTGQHPAVTTENNISRYREQLDKIGFSYDWSREVRTCDPAYYKWTQWAFVQMFKCWYNNKTQKAEPVEGLIKEFEKNGNGSVDAACSETPVFTAEEWKKMTEKEQQLILLNYRLAYLADTMVNWCPALGTVLANDEVVNGVSVRGGYPVEQKEMKQWSLRISAYAQRMLDDLEKIDWSDSLKEIQRNWIGRSEGANMFFNVKDSDIVLEIFTTRPDTCWGVSFMVLAPESDYVQQVTTGEYRHAVEKYVEATKKRTERERIADVKKVTGQFTGAYAVNPLTGKEIPVYVADYVLAGYGTGAIMAVPGHDSRDFKFARHFDLPVIQVVVENGKEPADPATWEDSFDAKEGKMINSGFINGLEVKDAIAKTIDYLEKEGIGTGRVNFRLRDAIFSRQRYWGEPFPVYFRDEVPYIMEESELPLELPEVDKFLPTEDGQPPLGRAKSWKTKDGYPIELSTMPGFAGSSAYYYRYMDPQNDKALVSKDAVEYWQDVDLYIGGTEHATGHLIYARFWNKFLFDLGYVVKEEPFKKLINQGMIQGRSSFVYRLSIIYGSNKRGTTIPDVYICKDLCHEVSNAKFIKSIKEEASKVFNQLNPGVQLTNVTISDDIQKIHVDVGMVENDLLNVDLFRNSRHENNYSIIKLNDKGQYKCGWEIEKMSKSRYNVVNPDEIVEKYGADTLRMYEMFLGPLEQSKPWDTNGIDGVYKFFRKLWRLYFDEKGNKIVEDAQPSPAELKVLHKTIKKLRWDIENFSFNTSVSAFMICVNELTELKCHKKAILESLAVILSPFAPHIAEELWAMLGNAPSITDATFPEHKEEFLIENTVNYPVSFNGKMRFTIELPADMPPPEVEKTVLADERTGKWLEGNAPKKVIVVPKRIINIVI